MSLFLVTFLLLYGGMHYYLFRKIASAFELSGSAITLLVPVMAVMMAAPILVRVTEKSGFEKTAMTLAFTGYTWMGILFLVFVASISIDVFRSVVHLCGYLMHRDLSAILPTDRQAFLAASLLSAGISVYGYREALDFRCEKVHIRTDKLPKDVGRLTIVQISDVHLGLIVGERRIRAIMEEIRKAKPDLLVSTGDLVDGQMDTLSSMAEELAGCKPRYGKIAVTGNHEFYAGIDHSLDFTRRAGFSILRGETVNIGENLVVAGVDDPAGERFGMPHVPEYDLLKKADRQRITILLKHRPVVLPDSIGLFDLQLSGHIHKGQIFPFNLVTRLFYPVSTGLSLPGKASFLYVSRGTGTWGPPIRFLAPPEITVIDFVNAREETGESNPGP
jgi:predicted MPP superfamily phosphohydrolase